MSTPTASDVALRREMSRVGGALYLSGGVLVLCAVLVAGEQMASPLGAGAVAAVAALTGVGLLVVGERIAIPVAVHTVSAALGSLVVSLIVFLGGEATAGLFGIFYVYVAAFAFYYFPLSWAVGEAAVSAVAYAVALAAIGHQGGPAAWVVAMGATVTAGALIGSLGHRQRDLARDEHERASALAAYDAARATLLRIVSHDLRGPLTTIGMSAQTILDAGTKLEPEVHDELLLGQRRQADRLLRLVNDVLDSERLREGSLQPAWQDVDVRELTDGIVRSLSAERAKVTVSGNASLRADPVFLERALENLLTNAVRHGRGEPVEVAIVTGPGRLDIVVDDHGPGVPEERRNTIFEPFVSDDRAHRSPGLGLSVARTLIRSLDGDIWVEDRPGGGARFVVRLPDSSPT